MYKVSVGDKSEIFSAISTIGYVTFVYCCDASVCTLYVIYMCMYERVRHSPASKLRSPSSPLCLFSTSFGNLVLMSSQRPWFTRVSDLVAFRSQEPTRTRHRGQLRLLCSNVPLRQRRQRLCVHGSVTGSINIPRHTGHMRSRRCTSAVVRDDRSNNLDVRFRYIFPYLLRDYGYCTGNWEQLHCWCHRRDDVFASCFVCDSRGAIPSFRAPWNAWIRTGKAGSEMSSTTFLLSYKREYFCIVAYIYRI